MFFYTFRIHLRMEISRQVIYLPRRTFKLVSFQKRNICFRRGPGLVFMGGDSSPEGFRFESQFLRYCCKHCHVDTKYPFSKKNICVQKNASLMGNHSVVIRGTLGSMPSYGNSFSVEKIALSKRSEKLEK